MEIVWRTDRHIVDATAQATKLVQMAVESLGLREDIRVWEVRVDDANAVVGIKAATREPPVSSMAFRCRGAMNPAAPMRAKARFIDAGRRVISRGWQRIGKTQAR